MKHLLLLLCALFNLSISDAAPARQASKNASSWWEQITAAFETHEITLDTKLVTADKKVSSLYTKQDGVANATQITSRPGRESSVSFYIDVDKMLGGKKLKKGIRYRLDSLSWHHHADGHYSGGPRKVIIANGAEAFITALPETNKAKITIHQDPEQSNLTFTRGDILEVTIYWRDDNNGSCSVRCYDAPPAPATIRGTAFNLTPEGELPDGVGKDNRYIKSWRFNSPAVRLRATSESDIDGKVIALAALGLVGLFLLIKLLRKNKTEN